MGELDRALILIDGAAGSPPGLRQEQSTNKPGRARKMHDQDTQPIVLTSVEAEQPPKAPGAADPPPPTRRSIVSAWGAFAIVLLILLSFAVACVVYRL